MRVGPLWRRKWVSGARLRNEREDVHEAEGSVEVKELKHSGDEKDENDHPGLDTTELRKDQGQDTLSDAKSRLSSPGFDRRQSE